MPVKWTCPHSNAVLCLAVGTEKVVASGAELGEFTLWNEKGHHHMSQDEEDTDYQQSPGQLFNPPLAHSLSVAACGNSFCCDAEDGKIRVFQITGTRFEEELFFKGNDGKVSLWDIGKTTQQKKQRQPKNHNLRKSNSLHAKASGSGHKMTDVAESISAKLSIEHREKINWVAEASLLGSRVILVADPTNSVTVYELGEM
ncbi:hypothetical protein XELAEV_18029971mg [Xenopus laevis]|uniref:WD repeat-containing protein 53 n=1 Tax=Xenopus laevis TaxID=8355 RepID=A0A974CUR3_XENLA|nr:hypothetical protein XELAEV_18029971mg [Xenopus laevis]